MKSTLNTELFSSAIKSKRAKKGLRETAEEIGNISAATLSRIEQGKLPDIETYIRICKWLNVSSDNFVSGKKSSLSELSEKERIVYQLRSSRELDADTINAMVGMVDMAFTKLKKHAK